MSIVNSFKASCAGSPNKAAIAFDDQSWTFAEFDRLTDNMAQNLLANGIEPGDRIALHLPNGAEVALGIMGCLKAGCVVVPVNTRLKGREIDYVVHHSGAVCYLGDAALFADIVGSCPAVDSLNRRYITGDSFDDLLRTPARSVSLPLVPNGAIATLLYTSGTTAQPRGVIHTHETLQHMAELVRTTGLDQDQVVLIMSSVAHIIGFGVLLVPGLLNGATTVISRPFDFSGSLDAMARRRCTYVVSTPVMFQGLLHEQMREPRDIRSGGRYICGGDCVTPALQDALQRVCAPIGEGYGMTETALVSWNRPGEIRIGSLGQPVDGVEMRLLDSAGGDARFSEIGEIWVRGPNVMPGYWGNADATAAVLQDGWLRTGDLARRDRDGFYWFCGRTKEVIIRGASNISPQEVEAVLCEHPAVAEAGVVGRPDVVWGEIVVAHVAVRHGHRLDEAELISFARERLADYKTPEAVVIHEQLPKGPTGKIQRRALRESLVAGA